METFVRFCRKDFEQIFQGHGIRGRDNAQGDTRDHSDVSHNSRYHLHGGDYELLDADPVSCVFRSVFLREELVSENRSERQASRGCRQVFCGYYFITFINFRN